MVQSGPHINFPREWQLLSLEATVFPYGFLSPLAGWKVLHLLLTIALRLVHVQCCLLSPSFPG